MSGRVWSAFAVWADRRLCRMFGHVWKHWEGGHVYAGDDWDGPTLGDGTPWAFGYSECRRCGVRR